MAKRRRLNLTIARSDLGMTQADMAKRLGVGRTYYSQIEAGTRDPSRQLAERICYFLSLHHIDEAVEGASNVRQRADKPESGAA